MKNIEVVAAVILDSKHRVLIARRKPNKSLGGKWEFPGGKVENKESHQKALERELFEEFNIVTETKDFIGSNIHFYEQISIKLNAYLSEYKEGEFKLIDHDKIEWVPIANLNDFDLADADIPLIEEINKKISSLVIQFH